LNDFFTVLNSKDSSINEHTTNKVRVTVGRGSSVFEVALLVNDSLGGDSGWGSSVGNTIAELVDGSSFMATSQSQVVVRAIDGDVTKVSLGKKFHRFEDSVITTFFSGGFEREVGVATRPIPITLDRLRFEGNVNVEFFTDSGQQISGNPELIATLKTFNGTNLELPLTGEDFGIKTRNLDTSSQTASHVGFSNISTDGVGGTDWAVVLSLRMSKTTSGETDGPSVGGTFVLKKDIFLLKTEPGLLINSLVKGFLSIVSKVGFSGGLEIRVICFTKNQISFFFSISAFVVSKRIGTEENRLEDDFRALSGGLSSGRTIVVPGGEVFDLVTDLGDAHGLGSQIETRTTDPDVFGNGSFVFSGESVESGCEFSKTGFHIEGRNSYFDLV
jgi:hypothetical protein